MAGRPSTAYAIAARILCAAVRRHLQLSPDSKTPLASSRFCRHRKSQALPGPTTRANGHRFRRPMRFRSCGLLCRALAQR